jgi:hypothetical protein
MNRLLTELQRLYGLPGLAPHERGLVSADGKVRAAVVRFKRAADWNEAAGLYQEVQAALELPPPAVSISGSAGYQLWFSFSEPVPVDQARGFLRLLRDTYLGDMRPGNLELWPDDPAAQPAESGPLILPPALDAKSGKWSAFIEPSLGSMFTEEPGLEMTPNIDRQADLLAGLASVQPDALQNALARLAPPIAPDAVAPSPSEPASSAGVAEKPSPSGLIPGGGFADPKSFLLAVMNDPAVSVEHRIEAAKVLLPYVESGRPR